MFCSTQLQYIYLYTHSAKVVFPYHKIMKHLMWPFQVRCRLFPQFLQLCSIFTASSIAAPLLQGPWFEPDLRLLSKTFWEKSLIYIWPNRNPVPCLQHCNRQLLNVHLWDYQSTKHNCHNKHPNIHIHTHNRKPHSDMANITMVMWQDVESNRESNCRWRLRIS